MRLTATIDTLDTLHMTQQSRSPRGKTPLLLGRASELARGRSALESGARLVVLTGIGGIGKSTLARAIAREAREHGDDVVVGWLEDIRTRDDVVDEVGGAFGLRLQDVPLDRRIAKIAAATTALNRPVLILDALEKVLEPGIAVIKQLLARTTNLRILVTSRVVLSHGGATEIRVGPLRGRVDGGQDPGIALFVRRCPIPLEETSTVHGLIDRIVTAVDRIPLAIEFAAARAAVLPLGDLAERVSTELQLVNPPLRDAAFHSMLKTLEWSWQGLSQSVQHTLAQLAIFRASFCIEDAQHVVDADEVTVLNNVQQLYLASMIHLVDPAGSRGPEYRLLAPVREFAAHKLVASGEVDAADHRHRRWFLDGLEPDDDIWTRGIDRLHTLLAERRAEFDRILTCEDSPIDRLRALIRRLNAVDRRSMAKRNITRLERAVAHVEAGATVSQTQRRALASGYLFLCSCAFSLADAAQLEYYLERYTLWAEGLDASVISAGHYLRGTKCDLMGCHDEAREAFRRAYETASAGGEPCRWSQSAIQWAWHLGPDDPKTPQLKAEALAMAEKSGSSATLWFVATRSADLLIGTPTVSERLDLIERASEAASRSKIPHVTAYAMLYRALLHHQKGEISAALECCRRAVSLTEPQHSGVSGQAYLYSGWFHHHVQSYESAVADYQQALELLGQSYLTPVATWSRYLLQYERGIRCVPPASFPSGNMGEVIHAWSRAITDDEPLVLDSHPKLPEPGFVSLLHVAKAAVARRSPPEGALLIGPHAIRPPHAKWVSTRRRPVLRAIIDTLVQSRLFRCGERLDQRELVTRVWPHEAQPMSRSSQNRLHVLLNSVRRLGLSESLRSDRGGWCLSPDLQVILVER